MKTVSLISLGCKVSQYESDAIGQELAKLGYNVYNHFCVADYYILNTCAVTNEAERKSRNYLSKILTKNKDAKIIVCGCASQNSQNQFLENPNVIFVLGNNRKNTITKLLVDFENNNNQFNRNQLVPLDLTYDEFTSMPQGKTRAYLKIQDGCNNFCSYCLIPFVRGRSRSRELCSIVKEAEFLSKTNQEIVLTGINMSDYKIDGKLALQTVMESLSHIKSRVRIGSLEVNIITDEFLQTLKDMPNFCPQFHLSMQSGCDRILKLMNRHYTKDEFLSKVKLIKSYFKDASITTDVIVGFPTETEQDFLETIDTIKQAEFYKMHIFPYSVRKGTRAEKMVQVNGSVKKERVKLLMQLDEQLHNKYLLNVKNVEQTVLTEEIENDFVVGYTENYIKVYLDKSTPLNSLLKVRLTEIYGEGAKAEVI